MSIGEHLPLIFHTHLPFQESESIEMRLFRLCLCFGLLLSSHGVDGSSSSGSSSSGSSSKDAGDALPKDWVGAAETEASYSVGEWMTSIWPSISNLTLLDLSLPGTHDSMTWDLSETVSDGSNDIPPVIAWVLHEFHDLTPGHFIKNQSRTQGLSMTQQLENGIRFIDFRIMYTSGPNSTATAPHDW